MATATRTRTLKLTCPCCGTKNAAITMRLDDLGALECGECSESYPVWAAVKQLEADLAKWRAVAEWIDAAPAE